MTKVGAFLVMGVIVVALAGVMPTVVNLVLLLILSGVILGHALGIGNILVALSTALGANSNSVTTTITPISSAPTDGTRGSISS